MKQSKPERYRSATPSMQRSTVVVRLLHMELVASSNLAAATRIYAPYFDAGTSLGRLTGLISRGIGEFESPSRYIQRRRPSGMTASRL